MPYWQVILGYLVSTLGGCIVMWFLHEKWVWRLAGKAHGQSLKKVARLSWVVGVVERILYTASLFLGAWPLIGVWLAIKVVARWQSSAETTKGPDSDNIWLIGTALSLMMGFFGAWIALGHLPNVAAKP